MSSDESDLTPESIKLDALGIVNNLIPEKSKEKYLKAYDFHKWKTAKGAKSVSESVLLVYFEYLSCTKKSSSLWCIYSMLSFTGDISDFFGPLLGLNYLIQLASCCLLLLECSSEVIYILVARFQECIFLKFSYLSIQAITLLLTQSGNDTENYGHVLQTLLTSLNVRCNIDAVYGMPWESMDLPNQRAVCILLQRVQTPINVTAMGMTPVGVQTMSKILKTTLSRYVFLLTINK